MFLHLRCRQTIFETQCLTENVVHQLVLATGEMEAGLAFIACHRQTLFKQVFGTIDLSHRLKQLNGRVVTLHDPMPSLAVLIAQFFKLEFLQRVFRV